MKLTAKEYAQALFEAVSETAPNSLDTVIERFFKALVSAGDTGKWAEIEKEFLNFQKIANGETPATVTFSREHKINKEMLDDLNKVAHKKFSPEISVQEKLVGGFVLRTEDLQIDSSLKSKLEELKSNLIT